MWYMLWFVNCIDSENLNLVEFSYDNRIAELQMETGPQIYFLLEFQGTTRPLF